MKKIVGFGDYLIHFSPEGYLRFSQASRMDMTFTGAEANVLAALSLWGKRCEFLTAIPENPLSQRAVAFIRGLGVCTDRIHYGDGRMGLYFLEKGASVRPSSVIYDREGTVFCASRFDTYDWDRAFSDCEVFYITGITAMLSESLRECCIMAAKKAKSLGIRVVFDLNYRSKLGSIGDFKEILCELSTYIDCLIINEEHAKMAFGLTSDYHEDEIRERLYIYAARVRELTGIPNIAMPVRRTVSASDARIYACLLLGDDFATSPVYDLHVIDRVGSGDAFAAGIIYGITSGLSAGKTISFAASASAIKHTVESDVDFASVSEIMALSESGGCDVKR